MIGRPGSVRRMVGALAVRLEALREEDASEGWNEAMLLLERLDRGVALLEGVAADGSGDFEARIRDLSLLRRVCDLAVSVLEPLRLGEALLAVVSEEFPCHASALDLVGPSESGARRLRRGDWSNPDLESLADRCARRAGQELSALHPLRPAEHGEWREACAEAGIASILVLPAVSFGRASAFVHLYHDQPERFGGEERRVIGLVADLLGLALRHHEAAARMLSGGALEELRGGHGGAVRLDLVQRDKLSALEKMAASVAHELNNPMGWMLSNLARAREYVEQLRSTLEAPAGPEAVHGTLEALLKDFAGLLEETDEGLTRVRRVAHELHAMGRQSGEEVELTDLNGVVESALSMARLAAKPRVRFEQHMKPVPPARCRRLDLVQAVFHLLVNALEAGDAGGRLRVTTYRAGGEVRIEVADDGPGVPAEHAERIFEPFFSTKEGHSGLGLPIARDVARAHGGELLLVDGGVFRLSLPLEEPAGAACSRGREG